MKISHIIPWMMLISSGLLTKAARGLEQDDLRDVREIADRFQSHPANSHELLQWLPEKAGKEGLSVEDFEFIRNNYLVRTAGTFQSVAYTAIQLSEIDYESLPLVSQNLREEGGGSNSDGSEDMAHMKLCEDAFNSLGRTVFGLEPTTTRDVRRDKLIVPETDNFRKLQRDSFANEGVGIFGRYLAHEKSASGMLRALEGIFRPYKGYFTEGDYNEAVKYFRAHIPESEERHGVEDRHGDDAVLVTASVLALSRKSDPSTKDQIIAGGNKMLESQKEMWDAWLKYLKENELDRNTKRVPPKKDFLRSKDDMDLPSKSIRKTEITKAKNSLSREL